MEKYLFSLLFTAIATYYNKSFVSLRMFIGAHLIVQFRTSLKRYMIWIFFGHALPTINIYKYISLCIFWHMLYYKLGLFSSSFFYPYSLHLRMYAYKFCVHSSIVNIWCVCSNVCLCIKSVLHHRTCFRSLRHRTRAFRMWAQERFILCARRARTRAKSFSRIMLIKLAAANLSSSRIWFWWIDIEGHILLTMDCNAYIYTCFICARAIIIIWPH